MRKLTAPFASLVLGVSATALVACSAAAPGQPGEEAIGTSSEAVQKAPEDAMHVQYAKGEGKPHGGTSGGNLIDHGGNILPGSTIYTIWWGNQASFPADAKTGIDSLFSDLEGSALLGVANQYMRGTGAASTAFAASYEDTSSPPSRAPATSTIVAEACNVINANHLTADPSAIYFVYASNMPGHTNYCAWHSYGSCNGVTIQVAYMPNTTGVAGCDPGNLYNCNSYTQGTRSLANVTSHEFMEAITDPNSSAWYDGSGSEIGDKCAWQFSSCVSLSNGASWQLQEEWSNATSGCVQQ